MSGLPIQNVSFTKSKMSVLHNKTESQIRHERKRRERKKRRVKAPHHPHHHPHQLRNYEAA